MTQNKYQLWTCNGTMYEKIKCMNDMAYGRYMHEWR